jgi:hypothetical protein
MTQFRSLLSLSHISHISSPPSFLLFFVSLLFFSFSCLLLLIEPPLLLFSPSPSPLLLLFLLSCSRFSVCLLSFQTHTGCQVHSFDPSMEVNSYQRSTNSWFWNLGISDQAVNSSLPSSFPSFHSSFLPSHHSVAYVLSF